MRLDYDTYLDKILGGWIGKSAGGAIGARFEGFKGWIEIDRGQMFPEALPPNDDLDLQVLWLSVLEEKGDKLTADDLAQAWLEGCWYPFNEYGNFRRNYRLGIKPPTSGQYNNEFFDTGMGCPIRSEIWGYVFPGAPDLAAHYASLDGSLDHSAQSIGAEKMLAAMASLAFFISDVRRLVDLTIHYLPPDTTLTRLAHSAIAAYDQGCSLREARTRLLALEGHPEACDARLNVPFTLLALLYADDDMVQTLLDALRCGYDTDCTCATATALIGQILGASHVPNELKDPIGDELVMGIQYRRPEMTLSALARDTARVGTLLAQAANTGVTIDDAPDWQPLPAYEPAPVQLEVTYLDGPRAVPGQSLGLAVTATGKLAPDATLSVTTPKGWSAIPAQVSLSPEDASVTITLHPGADLNPWLQANEVELALRQKSQTLVTETVGIEGAAPWAFLGVHFDPYPLPGTEMPPETSEETGTMSMAELREHLGETARRLMNQHFVRLQAPYIEDEAQPSVQALYRQWTQTLGKPAVIYAHGQRLDPDDLIGLQGPYVVYLAQELIIPDDRTVNLVIGNNDGYRLYVNGERVAEQDECTWWAPYNNVHPVQLQAGANLIVLKLRKQGESLDFSLGVRDWDPDVSHNRVDWHVDLVYTNPLTWE